MSESALRVAVRTVLIKPVGQVVAAARFRRAGIPESEIAMQMTGHKTRSAFERFNVPSGLAHNIVSDGDLPEAARKLDALVATRCQPQAVTSKRS
jgi:hypothetical protein